MFMATKKNESSGTSKDEEIGYHKGALSTLMNERNELVKMVQIVDSFIQAHAKRLQELGVKLDGQK